MKALSSPKSRIALGDTPLRLEEFALAADWSATVIIAENARHRVTACRGHLETAVAQGQLIYGVTTGHGPLANRPIDPEKSDELQ